MNEFDRAYWNRLSSALTSSSGGQKGDDTRRVMDRVSPLESGQPKVEPLVPAFRRMTDRDGADGSTPQFGRDLIERLAGLQNPALGLEADRTRFRRITEFVRAVIGEPDATLEVPHDRSMLLVEMNGRRLPLDALGTGVEEVVILAVAATLAEDTIIALEEPELHLHPALQRRLLKYLSEETSNQYFIATHSAHMLDLPGAAVFRVKLVDSHSIVRLVSSSRERWEACHELGYRASDLVQANAIVWVEGPSDRDYLRYWISAVRPDFVEGLHYSVMFYGGRLLNHLSPNDPEVDDFISLRRLNRNVAIVMDSDKASPHKRINATKKRIRDALKQHPSGFAWVTAGREIENYVPSDQLAGAVDAVRPGFGDKINSGRYEKALPEVSKGRTVDKLKVAKAVTTQPAKLDVHDLRKQVEALCDFIEAAN